MPAFVERLGAWDRAWLSGIAARRTPPWLDRLVGFITHAGGARFTILMPLGLLAVPGLRRLGVILLAANAVSHLVVQLLKRTVTRARPHLGLELSEALAAVPDAFSFPSGHACAAMAVGLPLVLELGPVAVPAMVLAILVGASRVYLRVHYVTDVLAGQLIGAAAAVAATVLLG